MLLKNQRLRWVNAFEKSHDSSNETHLFFTRNDCRHLSKPFRMPDLLHEIGVILKKKEDRYAG